MKKNIILFCASVMLISILASCSKNSAIPNFNTVTVTFANNGPKYVTSDITVNPKDSIQFSYTVTSPIRMQYVYLVKNGSVILSDTLKSGNKLSFTATKKLVADTANGPFTYAVIARDTTGYYLGTSKVITVTTAADFIYYTNRTLFVPDTVAKVNPCYFNSTLGTVLSYSKTGAAGSAGIDFGYYYNPDSAQTAGVKKTPFGHFLYALTVSPVPNPIAFYDISTWTKNATIFKLSGTPTFASILSGGGIKSGCATNLKTGTSAIIPVVTTTVSSGKQTDSFTPLASGNVIWFKTAAGKLGVIQIDYINQNSAAHGTFMTIDVKIVK
ncbi:hypothetical protein BDD43_4573 [Mucilaginibacter gracilis]|uniref:Uncharacterized protein n=1 Tax=Mucilaginibacter gracilis TaxID=423350 RepID=A0A495J8H1_9SPHI|nr:hypothetical protein [Mucilaginibacter gracilis]RKR84339.1 hypothetical protein BDD43_4573 [Mucilaginibacter gracilis]